MEAAVANPFRQTAIFWRGLMDAFDEVRQTRFELSPGGQGIREGGRCGAGRVDLCGIADCEVRQIWGISTF